MPAAQALVVQKQDPNERNNAARDFMVYFSLLMRIELMLEIVFKYRLKHWRPKSLLISYKKNQKNLKFSNVFRARTEANYFARLLKFQENFGDYQLTKQNFCLYEKYILRLIHFFQYI